MVTKLETMKRTINGLVLTILIAGNSFGQPFDQNRMDRDLEIAENILQTLSNSNGGNSFRFSNHIESSYIPEYGVIFSYSNNSFNAYTIKGSHGEYVISDSDGNIVSVPLSENNNHIHSYSYSFDDDSEGKDVEKEKEKEKKEKKEKLKEKPKKVQEEWTKKTGEIFKEQTTIFLVDYADLIGQLKSSDKIMITTKDKGSNTVWFSDSNKKVQSTGRTAEISKSDLIDYKQGKATRDATIKKIKFSSFVKDKKVERDLELFASIFTKLYNSDLSTTYYTSSHRVNYERLDNFGAIFNMKVYSSTNNNGFHTIRTTKEKGLTQEQRNEKINAMYPEFERSVKENIVNYGRTIKSLKPDEILMFKIRLTECKGCEMPKSIEVSVKANILADYGTGKITMDKATDAITIKKTNN